MSILWNGNAPSNILWSTGLSYVERELGPINTWTIPSTTTDVVSYSGTNTISLNGKGGHYEICYKSFTVNKSGSYTISYDYDLPTINFYGTTATHMHFGIYITTNQPPGGDMGTWSSYSTGNCNGTDICGPSSQYNTPGTGHVSFNYTLTAGTTYYLWVPMMNLADGVQTYLTFTNLNVKSVEQYYNTVEPKLYYNQQKIWPLYPSDMDFIYLANNFDGSKIPNVITTSDMGPYLKAGTITKNGSGSSCYLTNSSSYSNYLYIDLTSNRLNAMKANNGTYTYFVRVISTLSGIGGVISWRNSGNTYIYMIRSNNGQLQVHTNSGIDLGTTNFSLASDNVYKVWVNGTNYNAKNLTNGYTWNTTNSYTKTMSSRMLSFNADTSGTSEAKLGRFYGIAGIARATTAEEDTQIKDYLMSQGT